MFVTCDFRILTFEFYVLRLGFYVLFYVLLTSAFGLLKVAIKDIKGSEVKQGNIYYYQIRYMLYSKKCL